jgi:hypothetical protein
VTHRARGDGGEEFDQDEMRRDYLRRLAAAGTRARWVCAADKIHNANALLADLARTIEPESVWARFRAGKEKTVWWYRAVYDRLVEVGFEAPIMAELKRTVLAIEKAGGAGPPPAPAGARRRVSAKR